MPGDLGVCCHHTASRPDGRAATTARLKTSATNRKSQRHQGLHGLLRLPATPRPARASAATSAGRPPTEGDGIAVVPAAERFSPPVRSHARPGVHQLRRRPLSWSPKSGRGRPWRLRCRTPAAGRCRRCGGGGAGPKYVPAATPWPAPPLTPSGTGKASASPRWIARR